jgi:hypothetical protein
MAKRRRALAVEWCGADKTKEQGRQGDDEQVDVVEAACYWL